jgi:hypothetical protein
MEENSLLVQYLPSDLGEKSRAVAMKDFREDETSGIGIRAFVLINGLIGEGLDDTAMNLHEVDFNLTHISDVSDSGFTMKNGQENIQG